MPVDLRPNARGRTKCTAGFHCSRSELRYMQSLADADGRSLSFFLRRLVAGALNTNWKLIDGRAPNLPKPKPRPT
jgi:hypothetical protein